MESNRSRFQTFVEGVGFQSKTLCDRIELWEKDPSKEFHEVTKIQCVVGRHFVCVGYR